MEVLEVVKRITQAPTELVDYVESRALVGATKQLTFLPTMFGKDYLAWQFQNEFYRLAYSIVADFNASLGLFEYVPLDTNTFYIHFSGRDEFELWGNLGHIILDDTLFSMAISVYAFDAMVKNPLLDDDLTFICQYRDNLHGWLYNFLKTLHSQKTGVEQKKIEKTLSILDQIFA